MKSDIEIAMEAALEPIKDVIKKVDIEEDDIDLYGKYKAKISDDLWDKIKDRPDGKLILVTAINPTPAGRGQDHHYCWSGTGYGSPWKKSSHCTA